MDKNAKGLAAFIWEIANVSLLRYLYTIFSSIFFASALNAFDNELILQEGFSVSD